MWGLDHKVHTESIQNYQINPIKAANKNKIKDETEQTVNILGSARFMPRNGLSSARS